MLKAFNLVSRGHGSSSLGSLLFPHLTQAGAQLICWVGTQGNMHCRAWKDRHKDSSNLRPAVGPELSGPGDLALAEHWSTNRTGRGVCNASYCRWRRPVHILHGNGSQRVKHCCPGPQIWPLCFVDWPRCSW